MRLIDANALKQDLTRFYDNEVTAKQLIDEQPTVSGWVSVKDRLPPEAGEYIVAYYPCHWESIKIQEPITVGLDSFRGKTKWAKEKYQRVTHWMEKPEPPEEE